MNDDQAPLACVYTSKRKSDLVDCMKKGGTASYHIKTKMKSAALLLAKCRERGIALPIVISDAGCCINLVASGILAAVDVGEDGTTYSVERLQKFPGNRKLNELRLLKGGKNISENFIRPYALCFRPDFVG